MSKKVKATLVITVHYEDESDSMSHEEMFSDAKHFLTRLGEIAAGQGLLSGDSHMTVEEWDQSVTVVAK